MGDNRKPHADLTQQQVRELFDYNPVTGALTWLGSYKKGRVAGTPFNGYLRVRIEGRRYVAHRLIWLWWYGSWPKEQIDHINQVRDDNRILNLREATHGQNTVNRTPLNSSPYGRGVTLNRHGKFEARASIQKRLTYLGSFVTASEAQAAAFSAHQNKGFLPNERY